jgi:alkylated DNA repair dioxygenase AlkB
MQSKFNSCLLNLYHNGNEGMRWHSDDEESLGKNNNTIASLSFGAERKFSFKHKQTKQTVSIVLEDGSLLIMKDATQSNWLHSLPKSKNITQPRINLTFRTIRG